MEMKASDSKDNPKSLDDYLQDVENRLYDIENRPSNGELRFGVGFQVALFGGVGYAVPLFTLRWAGLGQWPLVIIPLLCAAAIVWWLVQYLKRRGAETKAKYEAHGGNTAGTSDLIFGQVTYEITKDGRWKWPTPSSGE
jgi:hypothetical protein